MRQRIVALACRPEFWLCCLLAWLLASACRSAGTPWARAALTEALRWVIGIGLTLTLGWTLRRTTHAARILLVLAGALAAAGLWDGFRADRGGVVGPYQDHQLYGSALLVLLPIAAALALASRETRWRVGALAIGAAAGVCLVLSQTRSAWAGGLAASLVFSVLWLFQSGSKRSQRVASAASASLLMVGAVLAGTLALQTDLRTPLTARSLTFSALDTDQSWQERLTTWRGASHLVAAHPFIGSGLGRYPGKQWVWTRQGSPLLPTDRPTLSEEAHSFYLQTAAEIGLVGLSLYAAALVSYAALGLRRLRSLSLRHQRRRALIIAALSMLTGQAVDAIASPSWQFAEVSLLFWAALGVGLAALRHAEPEHVPVRLRLPLGRFGQFAVSGTAAVLLVAQTLPLGLLSPVEAYSSPAGWVFKSCQATPAAVSGHVGDKIAFKLTAHYSTPTSSDQAVDVTQDSTTIFTATYVGKDYGSQFAKNIFTVPAIANTKVISISGQFKDTRLGLNYQFGLPAAQLTALNP